MGNSGRGYQFIIICSWLHILYEELTFAQRKIQMELRK